MQIPNVLKEITAHGYVIDVEIQHTKSVCVPLNQIQKGLITSNFAFIYLSS